MPSAESVQIPFAAGRPRQPQTLSDNTASRSSSVPRIRIPDSPVPDTPGSRPVLRINANVPASDPRPLRA